MTATQKLQPNFYSLEFYELLGVIRFIPYNNENRYILAADGELVSVLFSVASTKVSLCSLESVISEITDMEYISNKVRHKQEGSKQDMCRFSVIQAHRLQSDLLSKYNPTVEHSASRHLQLSPDSFKTHLNSFRFIWSPDYVLFLSSALHCFYPQLHCLLHGFLDTHLLIHSWCDIPRNQFGTVIGRWRWNTY